MPCPADRDHGACFHPACRRPGSRSDALGPTRHLPGRPGAAADHPGRHALKGLVRPGARGADSTLQSFHLEPPPIALRPAGPWVAPARFGATDPLARAREGRGEGCAAPRGRMPAQRRSGADWALTAPRLGAPRSGWSRPSPRPSPSPERGFAPASAAARPTVPSRRDREQRRIWSRPGCNPARDEHCRCGAVAPPPVAVGGTPGPARQPSTGPSSLTPATRRAPPGAR
jgi:hypothetical protein